MEGGNMKKILLLVLSLLMCAVAFAQKHQVHGKVVDDKGEPLVGVAVIEDGTANGVITDANGNYSINLPAKVTNVKFSYLGFATQTVTIDPKEGKVDVKMITDAQALEGSVVTALGITREEKSLGYSVSRLDASKVDDSGSANWLTGAEGKVAGLRIEQSSGGPDGTLRVTLRGENSISHNNNGALFIVDGIPVNTNMESNGSGASYANEDQPVDYGGGSIDINPEDIESMTVLKGAGATALYGSRAANGAIVITTKKSSRNKGVGISFSTGCNFEQAGYWPDFQYEYGPGKISKAMISEFSTDGITPYDYSFYGVKDYKSYNGTEVSPAYNSRYQYGERIEGQMRYMYRSYQDDTGEFLLEPYTAYDTFKGFFQTGISWKNTLTVDAGSGKGETLRVSASDTRNNWIVPNTGYNSQTVSINASSKRSKYIEASVKATYYRKNSDNLPMAGYGDASLLTSLLYGNASASVSDLENEYKKGYVTGYYDGTSTKKLINASNDNPYWIAYEHLNTLSRDRVYGSVSATGHIIPGYLDLMVRGGLNFQNDFRTQRRPKYSKVSRHGMYKEQTVRFVETNIDFLLDYHQRFGAFQTRIAFGGNMMNQKRQNINLWAKQLLEDNIFMLQNVNGQLSVINTRSEKRVNSLYGFASVSYKDFAFLEFTARNDWSSTLAPGHNSYFYPSVNASVLLDKACRIRSKDVDMIKLFVNWANVGNDTDPYKIISTYGNSSYFTGSYTIPTTTLNPDLKPENVMSIEAGFETSFFQRRLGLDFTFYDTKTTDQIINLPQDWASGSGATVINAGCVRNTGIEVALRTIPVETKDFKWNLDFTWAMNRNRLESLAPGVNMWQMGGYIGSRVMIYAFPGGDMGRIYGLTTETAPEGSYYLDADGNKVDCSGMDIVDAKTGYPVRTSELKDLGSIYPDWTGGIQTSLRYKCLTLSASFAASYGGRAYSLTNAVLAYSGKLECTLPGRYGGLVHEGVNLNEDGSYSKNTTITDDIVEYYGTYQYNRDHIGNNVFDTSYFKCKEVRLTYTLPAKYCKASKVFKGVSASIYGTNLFCITSWPQFDPEVSQLSGNAIYGGVESGSYPMTRSYGFNIKLNF